MKQKVKESSKKFYRINRGGELRVDQLRYFEECLSEAEWYETYDAAVQSVKEYYKGKPEEEFHPDVHDIALAPPDYGEKRYCTNVCVELLADIIGFRYLDEKGEPIPLSETIYYGSNVKDTW